jgi:hypothetical protein
MIFLYRVLCLMTIFSFSLYFGRIETMFVFLYEHCYVILGFADNVCQPERGSQIMSAILLNFGSFAFIGFCLLCLQSEVLHNGGLESGGI